MGSRNDSGDGCDGTCCFFIICFSPTLINYISRNRNVYRAKYDKPNKRNGAIHFRTRTMFQAFLAQVVNVTSDSSWFWMYVFPHRRLVGEEGGHRVIRIGVIWSAFVSKGYSIDSTSFQKRFGYEIHKNVIDSWSKDYLHRVSMTSPKVTPPHDNKFVSYVYKGFMIHEHSLIRFNNKGLLYHHL
jgi:hypothetical protein